MAFSKFYKIMTYVRVAVLVYFLTENFKKSWRKNERTCQRTHVQNQAYSSNSKHTYICDVCKLSNPDCMCTAPHKTGVYVAGSL